MKFDIKTLISEAIVTILNENRLEFLIKTFTGKDAKFRMSPQQLLELMKADPTTRPEQPTNLKEIQKVGNYVQWLINRLKDIWPKKDEKGDIVMTDVDKEHIRFFFEDIYRITEALKKYDVMKRKHLLPDDKKDINQVKSLKDLKDMTKDFDLNAAEEEEQQKVATKERSKEAKYLYEDARWQVLIPLTFEFSRANFADPVTDWCTASSDSYGGRSRFDGYTREGPLYVFIDKSQPAPKPSLEGKPVLQVHFGSSIQFKNADDREINVPEFFKNQEGLKKFFEPIMREAMEKRPFNIDDRLWQAYIGTFGANDEKIKQIIETNFKNLIQKNEDVVVTDDSSTHGTKISAYTQMLGYDECLQRIFAHVKPEVRSLEIKFKSYNGKGFDIPETIGQLTNATIFVFSGFLRSLPPSIAGASKLEMLCIDENPHMKTVPEELCHCPKIEVLNHINTELDVPPCLIEKMQTGNFIII
jgi:negative regulator of genetic competence, sporulation and motility